MKNNIPKFIISLISMITLVFLVNLYNSKDSTKLTSIKVYKKKAKKVVESTATNKDLDKLNYSKKQQRKIASKSMPPKTIAYNNKSSSPFEKDSLEFIDPPQENWKEKLASKYLKFMGPKLEVIIKYEGQLIEVYEDNKAKVFEQVQVSYVNEKGYVKGYKALVDPSNSKQLKIWDTDRNENFVKKPIGMTPTGSL